jgi:hypothetical protein
MKGGKKLGDFAIAGSEEFAAPERPKEAKRLKKSDQRLRLSGCQVVG